MNGKIEYLSLEQVAEFLNAFTGSTACFVAYPKGDYWVIEFTGGF